MNFSSWARPIMGFKGFVFPLFVSAVALSSCFSLSNLVSKFVFVGCEDVKGLLWGTNPQLFDSYCHCALCIGAWKLLQLKFIVLVRVLNCWILA